MVLHEPRISDAEAGCGGSDTAARFLHYDRKDKTVVQVGFDGNLLDAVVDGTDFRARVIWDSIPPAEYDKFW